MDRRRFCLGGLAALVGALGIGKAAEAVVRRSRQIEEVRTLERQLGSVEKPLLRSSRWRMYRQAFPLPNRLQNSGRCVVDRGLLEFGITSGVYVVDE